MTKSLNITAIGAVIALASTTAFASGKHAGGHGHEDAIGKPGVASKATRTVKVDMTDGMRFNPSSINVKQGETVRFIVNNSGKLKHELVLGTEKELKEHYELMKKNPEMEHAEPEHGDPRRRQDRRDRLAVHQGRARWTSRVFSQGTTTPA